MAPHAYALLRIIIIDSFWKGQVNELALTGHTQLEGTNGAGKTSLMRLLPLFYGMRPSEIVSKVDQARNFADYYLPRDSSMLIYEYQRPNNQTCMVLASSDGRGVHFKFIDAAYDSQYFIAEDKKPYSVSEVDRFYRNINADRSSFLGIDKYRQVIQNLRSGRKLKDVRQLQKRYAFSDQPCPHIDKVINGTIEKNLDFDAVKRMLVAIASDHLARNSIDEKEQISLNKEDISYWLADIQASRAVQQVAEKISLWQNDFTSLESLLVKLQHLHFEIIKHQSAMETQQQEAVTAKEQSRQALNALEKQLEQALDTLRKALSDLNAKISADQSQIDLLDEDKLRFDEDDAPSYQHQADQAPRLQNELNEVTAVIEAFEGNISKIQQKFEQLIQGLKLQKITDIAENEGKTAQTKALASAGLSTIVEVYQQQLNALNEQLNQQDLNLQMQRQEINNKLDNAHQQLTNVPIEPQLLRDIEQNQSQLSQTQDKQSQLYQDQSLCQKELNTVEKQREKQLDKHQQENRYLEQLRQEYAQVELQLIPEPGSLHHYLSHEPLASDWKENIGRLLSSEQLARHDLDPRWVGGEQSFYGLTLDLQQVQSNDSLFLDEAQLREKRDAIDLKRQQQVDKISQLDEHIASLTRTIDELSASMAQWALSLKQNALNLDQFKVAQQNLAVKKQLAIKNHKEMVNHLIASLNSEKKNNEKKQQSFVEARQQQRSELNNQMLEKRMVVESDRDMVLDTLAQTRVEIETNNKQRSKQLNRQKNTDLDKLDPFGEVDKRTTQRKTLQQALEQCAVFEQKARKYNHFMKDRYSARNGLVETNQNRSIQGRSLALELDNVQGELSTQIQQIKGQIKKINLKKQATDDLLAELNNSRHACEMNGVTVSFSELQPDNPADLSVSFCNDWLGQFKGIEKRLTDQLNKFNERFRKDHSSSELYENWQKLVADNDTFEGAQILFKYRDPIADLLSSAEQKQKSTYQLVTVNANMINEFYQHIENFGVRIKQIGKKLSSNVTSLAHFADLADINVTTVMKQEELDYWGPLKEFSKVFDLCRDQLREGIGEIPDDLVYAMKKLATYLPSQGFVLAHTNLFDIEFTITEKGQVKHARNARQLKKVSSTGLSYLAMLSLFAGILGMLRGDSKNATQIILPVDELGELAAENIDLLLQMFNDNQISILSASPSTDRHILSLYSRHYKLKDNKIFHALIPQSRLDELLAQRAIAMQGIGPKQGIGEKQASSGQPDSSAIADPSIDRQVKQELD